MISVITTVPATIKSSSATPSQSLSRPSASSSHAPSMGSHTVSSPFSQLGTVWRQTPSPQVVKPKSTTSSTSPSQSLSRPSQISTTSSYSSLIHSTPEPPGVHVHVPYSQRSVSAPSQGRSLVGNSSSTAPSQSSSTSLHSSGVAPRYGSHSCSSPWTQLKTVFSHPARPQVVVPRSSSTWPSQSSSM